MEIKDYSVGVPKKGKYKLVLNSDEERFGGNGAVLPAEIKSKNFECDGKDHMILFDLPPFGAAVYGFSYI
jgi:1,4-alpha-glucan branching enzyme